MTSPFPYICCRFRRDWRRLLSTGLTAVLFLLLPAAAGCNATGVTPQRVLNIAVILGEGGLGDRSLNDTVYSGLEASMKKYSIRFETVNYSDTEADIKALRDYADSGYDLIIGVTAVNQENIQMVAAEFPDIYFAVIDGEASGINVASFLFREEEGDFLLGSLAAMLTSTKKIGVITGDDTPAARRTVSAFEQGAAYQDKNVRVSANFTGTLTDPQAGLSMALDWFNNQGVDIIHNAAARAGLGIIEAARQTGNLVTGTDGDQRYLAPGNVIGSRPKRGDTAVEMLLREVREDMFTVGTRTIGLKENGISVGPFDETVVSRDIQKQLDALTEKMVNGEIVITE